MYCSQICSHLIECHRRISLIPNVAAKPTEFAGRPKVLAGSFSCVRLFSDSYTRTRTSRFTCAVVVLLLFIRISCIRSHIESSPNLSGARNLYWTVFRCDVLWVLTSFLFGFVACDIHRHTRRTTVFFFVVCPQAPLRYRITSYTARSSASENPL